MTLVEVLDAWINLWDFRSPKLGKSVFGESAGKEIKQSLPALAYSIN
jgi:hypothetical protein